MNAKYIIPIIIAIVAIAAAVDLVSWAWCLNKRSDDLRCATSLSGRR